MRRFVPASFPPSFQEAKSSCRSDYFGESMCAETAEPGWGSDRHAMRSCSPADPRLLGTQCSLTPQQTQDCWARNAVLLPSRPKTAGHATLILLPRRPKTAGHAMQTYSPADPRLLGTQCCLTPQQTQDCWGLDALRVPNGSGSGGHSMWIASRADRGWVAARCGLCAQQIRGWCRFDLAGVPTSRERRCGSYPNWVDGV